MNESISEANNKGILLNLARASLSEPLSFSALTSYQGHNTITGSFAYPGFSETTNQLRIQSLSVSGPSTGGTLGSDFNFVGYDDAATYTQLLKPVDLPTLAIFLRQEYNKELLYYLTIQDIRISRAGKLVDDFPNNPVTRFPRLNKDGKPDFARFGDRLQEMLQSGLTVQLGADRGSARICFAQTSRKYYPASGEVRPVTFSPSCDHALPSPHASDEASLVDANRIRDVTDGTDWDITFRSVFGMYRYLGTAIAHKATLKVLGDPAEPDPLLIDVTDTDDDCFVSERHRGRLFCVPNTASTTKQVFTLLHDLVKLSTPTAPALPPTVTARVIGGN